MERMKLAAERRHGTRATVRLFISRVLTVSIARRLDGLVQQHDQRRQARADQAQDEASTAREAEKRGNGAVLPERGRRVGTVRAATRPSLEFTAAHGERSAPRVCNRICKMHKLPLRIARRKGLPPRENAALDTRNK